MSEPIIRFNDVCKSFGPLEVLKDLSLQVQAREHVALIGPSGSGKTTILRILMTPENILRPRVGRALHQPQALRSDPVLLARALRR